MSTESLTRLGLLTRLLLGALALAALHFGLLGPVLARLRAMLDGIAGVLS